MMKIAVFLIVLAFGLTAAGATAQTTEKIVFRGQLNVRQTESIIIYLSAETDDLLGFCFRNKSAVGRAILSKCKNGQECEFNGRVDQNAHCATHEGFQSEARIISVTSVRRIASRK
ncbi:MAG TPA: hypothetical protein VGC97_17125 [Pyrinomonadaceae bacterium]|jgi:hypothetical protein